VSALEHRAGRFTPREVAAATNARLGQEWAKRAAGAFAPAEGDVLHTFGDYAEPTLLEKAPVVGGLVRHGSIFSGWAQRALPVAAEIAARHPGPTLAYLGMIQQDAERARGEGRPPYEVGTVPLGGTYRTNPLQLISPASPELAAGGDEGDRTL